MGTAAGPLPWVQESERTEWLPWGCWKRQRFWPAQVSKDRMPGGVRADSPDHGERAAKLTMQLLYLSVRGAVSLHQLPPAGGWDKAGRVRQSFTAASSGPVTHA